MVLDTNPIVETSTKTTIEEEETITIEVVIEIIGPITGITVGQEIGAVTKTVISTTIGLVIEGKIIVKDMATETKVGIVADPGIDIEIGGIGAAPEKAPNP